MYLFEFKNVTIHDKNSGQFLENFNFQISQGENILVMGPEGSGKMLFTDLMTAFRKPQSGQVLFRGEDISQYSEQQLEVYRSQFGHISYNFALINNMSVYDNAVLPLRYHTNTKEFKLRRMGYKILKKYQMLKYKKLRPIKLNLNQNLRAAFSRAIIRDPALLLVDHVINNQCPLAIAKFFEFAKEDLLCKNRSVIFVSFTHQRFKGWVDKVILIYNGKIVFNDKFDQIDISENPYIKQYTSQPLVGPMEPLFETIQKK